MTTIDESDYLECRDLCEHLEDKRAELTQRVAEIEVQFEKFRSLYHAEIATSTRYADRVRELEAWSTMAVVRIRELELELLELRARGGQ